MNAMKRKMAEEETATFPHKGFEPNRCYGSLPEYTLKYTLFGFFITVFITFLTYSDNILT